MRMHLTNQSYLHKKKSATKRSSDSIHESGDKTDADVLSQNNKSRGTFGSLKPLCRLSTTFFLRFTIRLFNSHVKLVLLYGSACWNIFKKITQRRTAERQTSPISLTSTRRLTAECLCLYVDVSGLFYGLDVVIIIRLSRRTVIKMTLSFNWIDKAVVW